MTGLSPARINIEASPRSSDAANGARLARRCFPPIKLLPESLELRRRLYVVAFGHHAGSILAYHIGLLFIPVTERSGDERALAQARVAAIFSNRF